MTGEGAPQHLPSGGQPGGEQVQTVIAAESAPAAEELVPPKPIPTPTDYVRALLAPYAHIARCPACLSYALSYWPVEKDHHIQAAALSYHETGHRFDPWEHGFYGA